jgi:hypothetical protein
MPGKPVLRDAPALDLIAVICTAKYHVGNKVVLPTAKPPFHWVIVLEPKKKVAHIIRGIYSESSRFALIEIVNADSQIRDGC